MLQRRLADGEDVEPDRVQGLGIEQVPAVEEEGGPLHRVEDGAVIERPVRVPLGEDGDGVRAPRGGVRILLEDDPVRRDVGEIEPRVGSVTTTTARSSISLRATAMAGDSRVSAVSFLKANPNSAMRLSATVSNIAWVIVCTNRRFWYSLIRITLSQYRATSSRP